METHLEKKKDQNSSFEFGKLCLERKGPVLKTHEILPVVLWATYPEKQVALRKASSPDWQRMAILGIWPKAEADIWTFEVAHQGYLALGAHRPVPKQVASGDRAIGIFNTERAAKMFMKLSPFSYIWMVQPSTSILYCILFPKQSIQHLFLRVYAPRPLVLPHLDQIPLRHWPESGH